MNNLSENSNTSNAIDKVNARLKVLIGFKCPSELKLRLSRDAAALNLTLSEFVESLLINYSDIKTFNQKTQIEPEKLTQLNQQVADLTQRLSKYECAKLKQFFKNEEGKEYKFIDADGNHIEIKVNTLFDVYTLMINSFKTLNS